MKKLIMIIALSIFCFPGTQATSLKARVNRLEKQIRVVAQSERASWGRIEKMYAKVLNMEKQLPKMYTKKIKIVEENDEDNAAIVNLEDCK